MKLRTAFSLILLAGTALPVWAQDASLRSLTLSADPTNDNQATRRSYFNTLINLAVPSLGTCFLTGAASTLQGVSVSTDLLCGASALSVAYGTMAGTAAAGNDARILAAKTTTQVSALIASGTAANVSGVVGMANDGTGAITAAGTHIGANTTQAASSAFVAAALARLGNAAHLNVGTVTAGPRFVWAVQAAPSVSGNGTADTTTATTNSGSQANVEDWDLRSGQATLRGPDGSILLRVSLGAAYAADYVCIRPGTYGVGATVASCDDNSPNAHLNLGAQGAGQINLYNGSGTALSILDPGAPNAGTLTLTPGTVANNNVYSVAGATNLNLATKSVSIGKEAKSGGANCLAVGNLAQCYGANSIALGYYSYDHKFPGVMTFQSGSNSSYGSNQTITQTANVTITGSSSAAVSSRLTLDGQASSPANVLMPTPVNGMGSFGPQKVTCRNMTTNDLASWVVSGDFVRPSSTLTVSHVTGTGAPAASDETLTGMTLSIAADNSLVGPSSSYGLNVSVSLPAASAVSGIKIACTARWVWSLEIGS